MPEALITPDVLKWARKRAQYSPDIAARKAQVRQDRLLEWEEGATHPTFRQARILAKAFRVPFGYLFLPSPPAAKLDIPDLRTVGGEISSEFSLDFLDLYHDILRKQEWFHEYQTMEGVKPHPFIGKFSHTDHHKDVANDIRQELAIDDELRSSVKNWEQFIAKLIGQAENHGILVMRNSVVGNNTHRHLNVDEFRGFAISDPIAPLIFINSSDAKSAQIFTLAHELAHLWIGESGVSNPILNKKKNGNQNQKTEAFCNKVAAELLVPETTFLADWNSDLSAQENLVQLSRKYRVSQLVIARRGYDLDCLTYEQFKDFYLAALKWDRTKKDKLSDRDGGPPSAMMQKLRNGYLFSQAVLTSTFAGKLPLRDAGSYLGIKPAKLKKYSDSLTGK